MSSILTVTELNNILSAKIKTEPKFRALAVKGEISDISRDRTGHLYFRLRDGASGVRGIMFASNAAKLRFLPIEGMSLIAYGGIDFYKRDGSAEIIATQLLPDGAGAEYAALQKLKEKLAALGVFSAPKKPVPRYPEKIAVVTSESGAALQDIKNIISRRYPAVKLALYPTPVQGIDAPSGIAAALKAADGGKPDVIILARGGGSSEDLSAFNTEEVVMAVFGCVAPVISAVGHETDWTLSDYAADLRAPTPSGAAELATPDIAVMKAETAQLEALMKHYAASRIERLRGSLDGLEYALSSLSAGSKIAARKELLSSLRERMDGAVRHKIEINSLSLRSLSGLLESLDPKKVISRGYAIVYRGGEIIPEADRLAEGDGIKIIMRGGTVGAEVKSVGDDSDL